MSKNTCDDSTLKTLRDTNTDLSQAVSDYIEEIEKVQEKFDQSISDYLLKDKLDFCCPEDHHAVLVEKECKNGQEPVSMIQVQDDECCSVLESSCDPGINYENTSHLCCGLHSEKFICCSSFD